MFRSFGTFALALTAVGALNGPAVAGCGACDSDHDATGAHIEHATMDVVDMAAHTGTFETFVAAVKAAGLVDVLKGEGPFTVFAPTDDAFAKLPEGTIASLLLPENKAKLTAILTYHVVSGKVMAEDVVGLTSAKTLEGSTIDIAVDGGTVMIDGAKVVQADVSATNGVIHVIDSVIMPN